jgi:hypothetical protein
MLRRRNRSTVLLLLLLALPAIPGAVFVGRAQEVSSSIEPTVVSSPAPSLFQRIVLFGASVTAGFDSSQPFGGPSIPQYRLANYLDAALLGTHEPIATHATPLLFLNVGPTMEKQVAAIVAARPSLVIGLDALFWFCYGAGVTDELRLARFEAGLRQLERIEAPLVVGDIPDASKAVGGILSKEEVPDAGTIARCNDRLKEWAAGRRNVIVFPIARVMGTATANEELTIAGYTWEKGKSRALIQRDQLHPSRHGLAGLAIAVLDAAASAAKPALPANSFRHDPDAVFSAGVARARGPDAARPAGAE